MVGSATLGGVSGGGRDRHGCEHEFLLCGADGKPLHYLSAYEPLRRLGKRIGIDLSPHRLRRTWATNLHSNGADLLTLSAALGHTSPETTKRYVGITDDNLHELSSRLDTDWLLA